MNDQSLWDLFVRTGLPEAYSLYHRTASGTAGNFFGQPFREPFTAGQHESHDPADLTQGA